MKLKYTGASGVSSVSFKDSLYRFTPECIVSDQAAIDHLLADGSYVAVDNAPGKAEILAEPEKAAGEGEKGFTCGICGKVCKSRIGLAGHSRSHQ
jgi:hypothetical protein